MTEKEAMESPLHHVWKDFSGLCVQRAESEWVASVAMFPAGAKKRLDSIDIEVSMLRRVLLERCAKFTSMRFEILCGVLVVTFRAKQVFWKKEAAKDLAAIYSFWEWELEQRERESGKDVP